MACARATKDVPSGLSRGQLLEILGVEAAGDGKVTQSELNTKSYRRAVQFVLSLDYSKEDSRWPNLAEKRYSFLRDLFNMLEAESRDRFHVWWLAHDTYTTDGSHVFKGGSGQHLLYIRASDGKIFRGDIYKEQAHVPDWGVLSELILR